MTSKHCWRTLAWLALSVSGVMAQTAVPAKPKATEQSVSQTVMDEKARARYDRTVQAMGGKAFLSWIDSYGTGRYFVLKEDGGGWADFWDYYKWPGKSRTDMDEKEKGLVDVFNLDLGKGWTAEYGKVRPKTEAELQRFRLSEKRNLAALFRTRIKEPGIRVFYFGPTSIDTVKPMEALEFVDAENYSVSVYFEEGEGLPVRMEYTERDEQGIVQKKTDVFYKWFSFQGVMFPKRLEFFTNGKPSGLVEYDTVKFNSSLPDSLFQEPHPNLSRKEKARAEARAKEQEREKASKEESKPGSSDAARKE